MKNFISQIQPYLPSRNVSIIGGIIIIGIIGFLIYTSTRDTGPKQALDISQIEDLRKSRQDTDSDGLFDWEEDLWHTSKTTSDSDGDGTSDGDEIKQKRDPMIKGPGDTISELQMRLVYTLPERNITQTKTEFYRSLPEITNLAKISIIDGKPLTKEDISRVVENSPASEFTIEDRYTTKDLKISSSITKEKFLESLILLLAKYHQAETNDLDLVISSVSENNTEKLLRLKSSSARYENLVKEILGLQIPRMVAKPVVDLVNALSGHSGALLDMSYMITDPLRGVKGITLYEEFTAREEKALQLIITNLQ